jgi:diguanylate cyclase (GGDEF)-like protein
VPYSVNALFTISLGITYLSAFFHAFRARSISFHLAMVEANRRLAEMAARDPLTGLFNARAYYALCEQALARARRERRPFAMLFVDLDHFKSINDRFGHEAGDTVLRATAICLAEGVRNSDLVGRIGGEEFSALLPDTERDGALRLAEKLRAEIEALKPDIGSERLPVTASVGIAIGGPESPSIAEVQRRADEAMYQAKRKGRNRVTCLDDEDVPAAGEALEVLG